MPDRRAIICEGHLDRIEASRWWAILTDVARFLPEAFVVEAECNGVDGSLVQEHQVEAVLHVHDSAQAQDGHVHVINDLVQGHLRDGILHDCFAPTNGGRRRSAVHGG